MPTRYQRDTNAIPTRYQVGTARVDEVNAGQIILKNANTHKQQNTFQRTRKVQDELVLKFTTSSFHSRQGKCSQISFSNLHCKFLETKVFLDSHGVVGTTLDSSIYIPAHKRTHATHAAVHFEYTHRYIWDSREVTWKYASKRTLRVVLLHLCSYVYYRLQR
jgi:hypothetical protein